MIFHLYPWLMIFLVKERAICYWATIELEGHSSEKNKGANQCLSRQGY
jgi:hypothetical protein